MKEMNQAWNPSAPSASIRKWVDDLHKEAKRVFLQDKTHAHMLFLFKDEGLVSVNPVPPGSNSDQLSKSVSNAIKDHDLYGVILVGEAWTYFPKEKDHTAAQLLDGEMKVSDLKKEDKTEALMLRMETRDKDCLICLDRIVRDGDKVSLGDNRRIWGEDIKWFN